MMRQLFRTLTKKCLMSGDWYSENQTDLRLGFSKKDSPVGCIQVAMLPPILPEDPVGCECLIRFFVGRLFRRLRVVLWSLNLQVTFRNTSISRIRKPTSLCFCQRFSSDSSSLHYSVEGSEFCSRPCGSAAPIARWNESESIPGRNTTQPLV